MVAINVRRYCNRKYCKCCKITFRPIFNDFRRFYFYKCSKSIYDILIERSMVLLFAYKQHIGQSY